MKTALLILEDGTVFKGNAFGSEKVTRRSCFYNWNDRLSRNDFRSIDYMDKSNIYLSYDRELWN